MKRLIGYLALATVVACGRSASTGVRLQGDPVAVASLAGSWSGEYWGGINGRHGSLAFELRPGTDSLFGDVMLTDPMGNVMLPVDPSAEHRIHARSAQRLALDFVMASGETVRGVLEPYVSPDCNCTVTSTFIGKLQGDMIEGTFETVSGGTVRASGNWRVTRAHGG